MSGVNDENGSDESEWYPGKMLGLEKQDSGEWYPGKILGRKKYKHVDDDGFLYEEYPLIWKNIYQLTLALST